MGMKLGACPLTVAVATTSLMACPVSAPATNSHIDLQSFDRLGDVARIDQRDLHLIERNAIVAEHDVQDFRGRRVAGDHADAVAGEL